MDDTLHSTSRISLFLFGSPLLHSQPFNPFSITIRHQPFRPVIVLCQLGPLLNLDGFFSGSCSCVELAISLTSVVLLFRIRVPVHQGQPITWFRNALRMVAILSSRLFRYPQLGTCCFNDFHKQLKGETEGDAIDSINVGNRICSGTLTADTGHPWTRILKCATHQFCAPLPLVLSLPHC